MIRDFKHFPNSRRKTMNNVIGNTPSVLLGFSISQSRVLLQLLYTGGHFECLLQRRLVKFTVSDDECYGNV